ncbi:hypothetical protein [Gorillibacterium sp. sgz500922]|uniref:hypothetical protein n=1 Tax=Gorillibacterium sp. sgz500922 TaxID=3446694 RepID=UPI003F680B9E
MGTRKDRGGTVTCSNCRKWTGKGLTGCHWICRDCQLEPGKGEAEAELTARTDPF